MKGIVCGVCGFVSLDGIPEVCPVCGAPKEKFSEIEDAYKMPDFKAQTGESEKKHIPALKVSANCNVEGCVCVTAKMGEIEHPMLPEHHITHVYFYLDKKYIGLSQLTPALKPAATIHIKTAKGKVSVIENCNVHGNWYNEIEI